MIKLLKVFVLVCWLMSISSYAGKILLTQFEYESAIYSQMAANLQADGHTVDIVDAKVAGNLANALNSNSYDQVFLWDLSNALYLGGNDLQALSNFWTVDMGITIDTRSYGHYYQGDNASEIALLQNIAHNLELSGGGIWIGTDHAPEWTFNANALLLELGFDLIGGVFSDPVNFADPSSVLLNGVTAGDLWGGGESLGKAPIGLQSNGVEMFAHYGNLTGQNFIPYVSASFDLQGPKPKDVPEPSILAILAFGLVSMSVRRKKLS